MSRFHFSLKVITLVIAITGAITCYAQSFVSKFPQLTDKNLPVFIKDWKNYSDSVGKINVIPYPDLAKVIEQEIDLIKIEPEYETLGPRPEYYVIPQFIEVHRYHYDADLKEGRKNYGMPPMRESDERVYEKYTVTPNLPEKTLYFFDELEKPLSEFLGGVRIEDNLNKSLSDILEEGNRMTPINHDNADLVAKYIPVFYGHWGGYWWFYSMPLITNVVYFDNLIIVSRRTSWHTGDVVWYVKTKDGFVKEEKILNEWIE